MAGPASGVPAANPGELSGAAGTLRVMSSHPRADPGAAREPASERGPRPGRAESPASLSAGLGTRVHVHVGGRPGPYALAVLEAVTRIPPGRVMTYGDVAEYVGGGTGRTVGAVLARFGSDEDVPWHRVIRASGEPNPAAPAEALRLLADDDTPLRTDGRRVDLAAARWDGRERS
jgi:alkylated DNA nucleotide flippase Atl1